MDIDLVELQNFRFLFMEMVELCNKTISIAMSHSCVVPKGNSGCAKVRETYKVDVLCGTSNPD